MHLTEAEQMATRRRLGIELGAGFLHHMPETPSLRGAVSP
jgi:hypothetical protein